MPSKRTRSRGRTTPINTTTSQESVAMFSSMSPQDKRSLQRLSSNMPSNSNEKAPQDTRFWRAGFDGKNDEENTHYQWSDYGQKSYKIRFKVDQFHSNNMKMIKWMRSAVRAQPLFTRCLTLFIPWLFLLWSDVEFKNILSDESNPTITLGLLRTGLIIFVLIHFSYNNRDDWQKVFGFLSGLLSLFMSRSIAPDEQLVPVPPVFIVLVVTFSAIYSCFNLHKILPYAFAGESVKAFNTADGSDEPKWIEETSLRAAIGNAWDEKWDKDSHKCEKIQLKDLYPKAGIPLMYTSTIDFAVYKNMSTTKLANLFKSRFWAFDLADSWPSWVKDSNGQFFSLESMTMDPERFECKFDAAKHDEGVEGSDDEMEELDYEDAKKQWTEDKAKLKRLNLERRAENQKDSTSSKERGLKRKNSSFELSDLRSRVKKQAAEFDGSDVYTLQSSCLTALNYPTETIFMKTPRKVWSKFQKNMWKDAASFQISFKRHWLLYTFFAVCLLELIGISIVDSGSDNEDGVQSTLTHFFVGYAKKYVMFMWQFLTDPLRHLYRYGPSVTTSVGTYGFWEGKNIHKICELKSGASSTSFNEDFWNDSGKMNEKCQEDYQKWEDQFVNGFIGSVLVYYLYTKYWQVSITSRK